MTLAPTWQCRTLSNPRHKVELMITLRLNDPIFSDSCLSFEFSLIEQPIILFFHRFNNMECIFTVGGGDTGFL